MNDKYIVHFISSTRKKMIKFIEDELKEHGIEDLVPTHGSVLTALYESELGKLTMKEISKKIGKDKSTVTPLVNKMIKAGYIQKGQCKTDKRISYISLTQKGKDMEAKYDEISKRVNLTAYDGFSDEEKEVFLKLLKKMNTNFSKE